MTRIFVEALLALAVLVLVGVTGYTWRGKQDAELLAASASATTQCEAAAKATRVELDRVIEQRNTWRQAADDFRALADAEIAARDDEIARLNRQAAVRQAQLWSAADDPDCAALAALPLCPAVARQLWPADAADRSGEPAGRDR